MRRKLTIDGISIFIDIVETGQKLGKYQFSSSKYDIWCFDDCWEVAQEDLAWILKDKVKAYMSVPYSSMKTKSEQLKWKRYEQLHKMGLTID